jgi:hypothetical protein
MGEISMQISGRTLPLDAPMRMFAQLRCDLPTSLKIETGCATATDAPRAMHTSEGRSIRSV